MEPQLMFVRATSSVPGISAIYGYESTGQPVGVHQGVPSGSLTVVISLDDPIEMADDAESWQRGRTRAHDALVSGLHTRPAYIRQPVSERGIQLAVHPLAARRLFGMPTAELAQRTWEAESVLGPDARQLRQRLHEIDSWPARLAAVEEYFTTRAGLPSTVRREVTGAWSCLASAGGARSVAELADEVGVSERQLSKLMTQELGVGPKMLARLLRFDHALGRIGAQVRAGTTPNLAEIAVRCGFYDQSHLARDFHLFTDRAPSRFVADEFRNIQAGGHQPPTGLTS
ncbi:AraC family transcriptional regulator [Tomitella biformata]|uniref:AraC family transcriptional regulator n=1 Tax=Tomitella biformata TaxID=630403 RepID=UPI0005709555|nr:helix-turn-helix domain-containing protein [Tomitella biformata]